MPRLVNSTFYKRKGRALLSVQYLYRSVASNYTCETDLYLLMFYLLDLLVTNEKILNIGRPSGKKTKKNHRLLRRGFIDRKQNTKQKEPQTAALNLFNCIPANAYSLPNTLFSCSCTRMKVVRLVSSLSLAAPT